MKILAIRGSNIASLEGEFEIDFTAEPLLSNGIYAITGPTGAGKSSILDTLSLALYENTPRLNRAGDTKIADVKSEYISVGNPVTLLRRGAVDGFAEVDFVGNDGNKYRSRWSVRRAHGKAMNRIQNTTVTLTNLTKEQIYPEKKKETLAEISRLVGLTYDQFSRTVLLAQGEFAAFLKAGDNDRASLLEKLTGTQIYSLISMRIYENTSAAKKAYDELQLRMQEHHLLSEEELQALNEQLVLTQAKLDEVGKEQDALKALSDWFVKEADLNRQIKESSQSLEGLKRQKEHEEPNKKLLHEISLFSPAFSMLIGKRDLKNRIQTLEKDLLVQNGELATEETLLAREEKEHIEISKRYHDFLSSEDDLQKKIRKAYNLEEQIKTSQKALLKEQETKAVCCNNLTTKQNQVKEWQRQITAHDETLLKCAGWLEKNKERKEVAENASLIVHQLEQAELSLQNLAELNKQQAEQEEGLKQLQKQIADLESTIKSQEEALKSADAAITDLKKQKENMRIEELKIALQHAGKRRVQLSDLLILWNQINPLKKEISNNEAEVIRLRNLEKENDVKLLSAQTALVGFKSAFEQAETNYRRIREIANENIESIRASLLENEPCPVCGSKEHPFHDQSNVHFRKLAEEGLKAYEELQQKVTEEDKKVTEFRLNAINLKEKIEDAGRQSIKLHANKDEFEQKWNKNDLSAEFDLYKIIAGTLDLLKVIDETDVSIGQYNNRIEYYEALEKRLNELQHLFQKNNTEYNDSKHKISVSKVRLGAFVRDIAGIRTRHDNIKHTLDNELNTVDDYFKNATWRTNWRENPVSFSVKLKEFAGEWIRCLQQQEDCKNDISRLKSNVEIETKNITSGETDKERLTKMVSDISDNIEAIKRQSIELTGNYSASDLELATKSKKEKLTNDFNLSSGKIEKLKVKIAGIKGKSETLRKQVSELEIQRKTVSEEFDIWLSMFNQKSVHQYTEERVTELLDIPDDWIVKKREELNELEKNIVAVQSQMETHLKNLEKHKENRTLDFSIEELKEKQAAADLHRKEEETTKIQLSGRLNQHSQHVSLLEKLAVDLESKKKAYQAWSKLNAELGKSDGGKFKNIAQCYTLDLLLQVANVHIRSIAPRYRLERIPESLSLQVTDRDMCDQVRSIHSLSGGETFLVSLALALGLSSLSSKNINIESLFIDEGFGSLDEESLMMAMDALESLRLQGRKVGVITHVKEMTERITTRIRVNKNQNGSSYITIE